MVGFWVVVLPSLSLSEDGFNKDELIKSLSTGANIEQCVPLLCSLPEYLN